MDSWQGVSGRIASSIDAEHQWRNPRAHHAQPHRQPGNVPVSRWTRNITTLLEVVNRGNGSDHYIGLALTEAGGFVQSRLDDELDALTKTLGGGYHAVVDALS
ncbi:hypothetical protein [Paraburkholderia sp. RL17-347-BIC-D]|uniref:hypothetical protein n=1 Tax=Paraburkholderia sp. RL17-347-BIC-D TaxID=3031632 RepID=UPI0038BC1CC6